MSAKSVTNTFVRQIKKLILPGKTRQCLSMKREIRLKKSTVEIPCYDLPVEITLGDGCTLLLAADTPLLPNNEQARGFMVYDADRYPDEISGFLRVEHHTSVTLGCHSSLQKKLFRYSASVGRRHMTINHIGDRILIRDLGSKGGTTVACVKKEQIRRKLTNQRLENLIHLRQIIGGPLEQLAAGPALSLIQQVNALPWTKKIRPKDSRGEPGGLVTLPEGCIPIILGDLHAALDNLLTILSVNGFLKALEEGKACLVILGDSVHCEGEYCLAEMFSSTLIMDVIFKLMIRFPQKVIYLRGNHDGFGQDVYKGGVPQGLLWANHLEESRGAAYVAEMTKFYESLPVMAVSDDLITCHGAPPTVAVDPTMIVNIFKYPALAKSIVWNRVQQSHFPSGYHHSDVRRLRESFKLAGTTPVIVAHTPITRHETIWSDVRGMANHHIVYSGRLHQTALFTRIGNTLLPLVYYNDAATEVMDLMEPFPDLA